MPNRDAFPAVFEQLKALFLPFAPRLVVEADTPENYTLNAPPSDAYPRGLFFGAVRVKKNYVSYHLMPVYMFPDLLEDLPAPLRRRMQGKSCFNFTTLDPATVSSLAALTATGFERYRRASLG